VSTLSRTLPSKIVERLVAGFAADVPQRHLDAGFDEAGRGLTEHPDAFVPRSARIASLTTGCDLKQMAPWPQRFFDRCQISAAARFSQPTRPSSVVALTITSDTPSVNLQTDLAVRVKNIDRDKFKRFSCATAS
jgi:hypothetical protein